MARQRIYLTTVGHVLTELCRQYRRADKGELDWANCARAAAIPKEIRSMIETSLLEDRVVALERLAGMPNRPKPVVSGNGHLAMTDGQDDARR